ncbi:MAG: HEAT repeat domain-containing protein [Chloroflexota bacterium]|nr:HEAT repeat domain-containing protein [Chloroflexota bacterium]
MAEPDPVVLKQVLSELRDSNKDRRRTAVMKLGMLGGDDAVINLIRIVVNHTEDLIVRGRAAQMLGKLGDVRAVDPLIQALDAPGFQTTLHAVESLGMIGDKRAVEPLREMLSNSHDKYRAAARTALHRMGIDPDSTPDGVSEFSVDPLRRSSSGLSEMQRDALSELPEIVPVVGGDARSLRDEAREQIEN